ncbi:MAG: TetR/AcrR family transcriptional regulator [Clostridiales bacterium]|nr:TetR/AcrR family transcriptional regulator [Clostridiales bacterium]
MPKVTEDYIENKKKAIIDAAYEVCRSKPLTSVEMKDIIEKTGFSHGVIYRYYQNLDEVLLDILLRINQSNNLNERFLRLTHEEEEWKAVIRQTCKMLSDMIVSAGTDTLKIAAYADTFAVSDPERVLKISERLNKKAINPIISLEALMNEYLKEIIEKESLQPTLSLDNIMQFMSASARGIQTDYLLSESFGSENYKNRYNPEDMFSCLAESLIIMLGGTGK